MLSQKTIKKIRKEAIKIDWEDAFGGKSKGNQHLYRVTEVAKFLASELGANTLIVEAGALLHDTPLPSGDDYNYENNKRIVKKLLEKYDITEKERAQIAECVASHEGTREPKTLEAKIVHDADALEKAGTLGLIRHTWKLTNLDHINSKNITEESVNKVLEHLEWRKSRLQTDLAKQIHNYLSATLSKEKTKELVSEIAPLAKEGVITEEIAKMLSSNLNSNQREKLKEQLNLTYFSSFKSITQG